MFNSTNHKHSIRNPEKWIGKYVRHMSNWMDYQWEIEFGWFVCEWTGKLFRASEWAEPMYYDMDAAVAGGYDECYYYSQEAIDEMVKRGEAKLAAVIH